GARVHAMEINPESFSYLTRNIAANGLGQFVTAENGDCRDLLKGTYDRILMGHFDSPDFLPDALQHSTSGTTLHVHGLGDREADIEAALVSAGFRFRITKHKVKKYAAHTMHCVWDVTLS
ncbi:MAG: SAM-dependent methyltransferase, partial [Methanocorpusculum sp.]|nr:SAM-dependent methyltransferase [Methanocorpusculum sp.]